MYWFCLLVLVLVLGLFYPGRLKAKASPIAAPIAAQIRVSPIRRRVSGFIGSKGGNVRHLLPILFCQHNAHIITFLCSKQASRNLLRLVKCGGEHFLALPAVEANVAVSGVCVLCGVCHNGPHCAPSIPIP